MNSSNNINIDLRPGTRLVRETRGGREVMWVEEDSWSGGPGSNNWVMAVIIIIFVIFFLASIPDKPNETLQKRAAVSSSIDR